jgi:hypothetical protein
MRCGIADAEADGSACRMAERSHATALFVSLDQQNQQPSNNIFLSQQTSEQYFLHNKPAKRTGCTFLSGRVPDETSLPSRENC